MGVTKVRETLGDSRQRVLKLIHDDPSLPAFVAELAPGRGLAEVGRDCAGNTVRPPCEMTALTSKTVARLPSSPHGLV
jgi:hypothetical protein